MKILLQIGLFLLTTLTFAQDKTYILTEKKENADINYNLFELFGDIEIYKNDGLQRAFKPVEGNFTIYIFVSEFEGQSFNGTIKLFHDYLILKVDPKTNEIIDGYQYTMEWAEPPPISDLYRVTHKGNELKNGMNLNELEMRLVVELDSIMDWRMELKDNGQLKME